MDIVRVKVSDLVEKIKENKKKHDILYKEAVEGYWKKCKAVMEKAAERLETKNPKWQDGMYSVNALPADHSQDYDRAICMLEMTVTENIEIKRQDFESYVMNRWSWRDTFLSIHTSYTRTDEAEEDMMCMHGKDIDF